MFIDFGANDSGVDISGVKFESVNAVVVDQTTRFVTNTRFQCFKKILDFWYFAIENTMTIFLTLEKLICKAEVTTQLNHIL